LVWPARILLTGFALLLASACSGDAPKSSGELPPEGSVKQLSAADKLIFSDQLGSVLAETTGTGEVTGRFASYPFGVSRYDTSAETQRYATGIRDAGAGLDLMGARFYSHSLGFWTSGDPVAVDEPERYIGAEFGAANPYAYVNLTPLMAVDTDGNFLNFLIGPAVGAGVGFLVGGGIEAARQYATTGKVEDWGRVGGAGVGGAIQGGIMGFFPGAGLGTALAVGAASTSAAGAAERLIASGGKSAGTVEDVLIDMTVGTATAGAARGLTKTLTALRPVKPAMVLDSEKAFQRQYRQLQAAGGAAALGRGSTANLSKGTTLARNLREKLAIEQATANPTAGRALDLKMSDPRWPASEGWSKMQQVIQSGGREGPVNVHYLLNQTAGAIDDFKIVLQGAR